MKMWSLRLAVLLIAFQLAAAFSEPIAPLEPLGVSKCTTCPSLWSLLGGKADGKNLKIDLTITGTIKRIDDKNKKAVEESYQTGELVPTGPTAKPGTILAKSCPENLFNLIHGSCYKVLVANTDEHESASICKKYARENDLPERDVNLGIIRNEAQNNELLKMALRNDNITSARNALTTPDPNTFDRHMWIGIRRDPSDAPQPDGGYPWKYSRHGNPVLYKNFNKDEPNNHLKNEFCVYMYLNSVEGFYTEGTWNDHLCTMKNVAVLCEYMDPSVFVNGSI